MENVFAIIEKDINATDVVLFMKGTKDAPCCGFSAAVVTMLGEMKVVFKDIDVLQDNQIREGIKKYSDWPTIPQLYVKGRFIGGADIVQELYLSGELRKILSSVTATN